MMLVMTGIDKITTDMTLRDDLGLDSLDFAELLVELAENFDIEVPESVEFVTNQDATVADILSFLDRHLGPEYPDENGLLTLTDDQFIYRYVPEESEGGPYYRQREWHNDEDRSALLKAIDDKRCWTAVSDDNGDFCIVWGNRTVNRLYNIITSVPIEDESWEVQVPDDVGPRILCDVDWDTTDPGEEEAEPPDLPKQVVVRLFHVGMGEMTDADTAAVADYLSNEYGFCVNSFTWRELAEGEEVDCE